MGNIDGDLRNVRSYVNATDDYIKFRSRLVTTSIGIDYYPLTHRPTYNHGGLFNGSWAPLLSVAVARFSSALSYDSSGFDSLSLNSQSIRGWGIPLQFGVTMDVSGRLTLEWRAGCMITAGDKLDGLSENWDNKTDQTYQLGLSLNYNFKTGR